MQRVERRVPLASLVAGATLGGPGRRTVVAIGVVAELRGPQGPDRAAQGRARGGQRPGRDRPTHEIDRAADLLAGRRSGCRGPGTGSVPASAAASIGSSCAFIRTRTAISAAGVPAAIRARTQSTSADSSTTSVLWRTIDGSGPAGRVVSRSLGPSGRGEQAVGQREDLRARAVVVAQGHDPGARMPVREAGQVLAAGAGERVDRLVLVADDAHVGALPGPQLEQSLLEQVRVLVLVDAEPALAGADGLGGLGVGLEQVDGLDEQVVEVDSAGARPGPARSRRTSRTKRSTGIGGFAGRAAGRAREGRPRRSAASVGGSSPIRSRSRCPWPA